MATSPLQDLFDRQAACKLKFIFTFDSYISKNIDKAREYCSKVDASSIADGLVHVFDKMLPIFEDNKVEKDGVIIPNSLVSYNNRMRESVIRDQSGSIIDDIKNDWFKLNQHTARYILGQYLQDKRGSHMDSTLWDLHILIHQNDQDIFNFI